MKPLYDRLIEHAAVFEKIAQVNMAAHYEEVIERGKEAKRLSNDLQEAASLILDLQKDLANADAH